MKDLTSNEDPFEDRALLMVLPSENSRPSSEKSHLFLKPCSTISIDGCEAVLPPQNLPESPPDVNALPLSVSFHGYRFANINFKSWARKMSALHKPTWEKAGILEAVMASTKRIYKNKDLVLGIAEKWCSDSKTFVFPWGETTITLEDVMVLLGFSVLGSPVFATLDSAGEKIKEKVETEWVKIRREKLGFVGQVRWMKRFMNSDDDELEHVAFLVLWLSYFVFPSCYYHIHRGILPIAVHLSRGNRLALAPVVLAHLYEDLTLLKNHIRDFKEARETDTIDLSSSFKLVQVWTWERFRELQPTPKPLLKGEPRLARWNDLKQESTSNVRQILENSNMDSFDWRPYTKAVENWEFPKFYPEEAMWVSVGPNLDGEFISFARCIKMSRLVGFDCVEHYFPDRVASQFGMLQDVPAPFNRNNLSPEAAWKEYDKPFDDFTLYIPSRYAKPRPTPMYCQWWMSSYPEFQYSSEQKQVVESAKTLKLGNIIGDDETSNCVPTSSKISRTSGVGIKIIEDSTNERRKCMKQARDKRREYMTRVREDGSKRKRTSEDGMKMAKYLQEKRRQDMKLAPERIRKYIKLACEKTRKYMKRARAVSRDQKQVPSKNDEEDDSGRDASEPVGKKTRLEADNNDSGTHQKVSSSRANEDEAVPPADLEQRNEETHQKVVVSPPETRQCYDNELDVCGNIAEKMTMIDDGSKEPECFLHEDVAIAGEKASSDEKEADGDDDDLMMMEKRLAVDEQASKVDNNESSPCQNLAPGGANGDETGNADKRMVLSPSDELNIHIAVGDGTQGQDCLVHDDGLGTKEAMKSNEQLEDLEKRNDDFGEGDDSYEKNLHQLKVLTSSIRESIGRASKNVAWLKARKAMKQAEIAAARLSR